MAREPRASRLPKSPQLVLAACWQAMAGLRCINGEVDFSFYSTYEQPVPRRHRIENKYHDMRGASESPEVGPAVPTSPDLAA